MRVANAVGMLALFSFAKFVGVQQGNMATLAQLTRDGSADVSPSGALALLDSYNTNGEAWSVYAQGSRLFVGDGNFDACDNKALASQLNIVTISSGESVYPAADRTLADQVNNCGRTGKDTASVIESKYPGSQFSREPSTRWAGIKSEEMQLPQISRGSLVLDVGSGNGIASRRMRDELGCNVFAIEPGIEASNVGLKDPYEESKLQLGDSQVKRLTSQEASRLGEYQGKYDAVTMFKYNVSPDDKEEVCQSLSALVNPTGTVFIHSVEEEKCFRVADQGSPSGYLERPYLIDALRKYFRDVQVQTRTYSGSNSGTKDGLIICRDPIR